MGQMIWSTVVLLHVCSGEGEMKCCIQLATLMSRMLASIKAVRCWAHPVGLSHSFFFFTYWQLVRHLIADETQTLRDTNVVNYCLTNLVRSWTHLSDFLHRHKQVMNFGPDKHLIWLIHNHNVFKETIFFNSAYTSFVDVATMFLKWLIYIKLFQYNLYCYQSNAEQDCTGSNSLL